MPSTRSISGTNRRSSRNIPWSPRLAFLLISVVKVFLILTEGTLIAFAAAGFAEIVIGSFGMVTTYRVCGRHIRSWRANVAVARRLLKDSWPLILSGIAIMIYMRIDQVMIGEMVGRKEVGVCLSDGTTGDGEWYFLTAVLVSSVFPSIVEARKWVRRYFMRDCKNCTISWHS